MAFYNKEGKNHKTRRGAAYKSRHLSNIGKKPTIIGKNTLPKFSNCGIMEFRYWKKSGCENVRKW